MAQVGRWTLEETIQLFRSKGSSTEDGEEINKEAYKKEVQRINEAVRQRRKDKSFIPAMYLKGRDVPSDEAARQLNFTSKAFELNLRFKEVERLDEMYNKLWEYLSANNRTLITMEEYMDILKKFNEWNSEGNTASVATQRGDSEENAKPAAPTGKEPLLSPRPSPQRQLQLPLAPRSSTKSPSSCRGSSTGRRLEAAVEDSLQRPLNDGTALEEALFVNSVAPPRPTLSLFLMAPRNMFNTSAVDISVIFENFGLKVSLVKSEAELLMYDSNNDGRVAEDEMEEYVRDLVPRIDALRDLPEELVPFYCCTASRRVFWDLDPYSRGMVRIDNLLRSSVMEEWVRLQLLPEDNPQNWFSGVVTQQLYEKFLMLDKRNEGTLNAANLKLYKKGLPTVIDDGLPLDVSPLSTLFIDRYFETNVMMSGAEMDFRKFVDFVIAMETLPSCSRPHFFWKILDIEGTGVLTPMIVNSFFRETHAKLLSAGLDIPSRETIVQEVFDLIPTAQPLLVTREEFIRSSQAGLFTALIIDCLSFWTYENREQR